MTLITHPLLLPWLGKNTAISLLPLCAVRPVQSFSACTVQLYFHSPMGRSACTEPQCLYSTAIPLIPYGSYGLYSASVPVQYSYTITPPMGRTAGTEPQCLYFTVILLHPYGPYGLYRASVPVQYTYISTPPMGRTACTQPLCL